MKRNLLIALALPAMLAACSQEDVINESVVQTGLLGTPAGEISFVLDEGADSRVNWGETGSASWSNEDAFSLFWLGANGENKNDNGECKSATNALYLSEGGSEFTSKNIVYEGKHVIVYPADYGHVTDKEIVVGVGAVQQAEKGLGDRTVLVSDLMTIESRPEDPSRVEEGVMYAGYAEPVHATVAPLSSNLVLNLNFEMTDKISDVKIEKVELRANENIFAYNGKLKYDGSGIM